MNGKARDTIGRIAVSVGHNVADRLVKHIAMQRIPDRLIHNAKIFSIEAKGILPGGHIENKEQAKSHNGDRNQRSGEPEHAGARHWFWRWIEIEPIAQDREALTPCCTNHAPLLLPHLWVMAHPTAYYWYHQTR